MRNAALALLLTIGAPGLVLPAGIELRMCFCGGLGGGCCSKVEKAGCKRCCSGPRGHDRRPGDPIARSGARCSGCVRLSVPASEPAPALQAPAIDAIAPPAGDLAALPPARVESSSHVAPPLWHPPPGARSLPLLI